MSCCGACGGQSPAKDLESKNPEKKLPEQKLPEMKLKAGSKVSAVMQFLKAQTKAD